MSKLDPDMVRIDILASTVLSAAEFGVPLPRLGELRCLPGGSERLLPIRSNVNVELLVDQPSSEDIDEDTECIAGIIQSKSIPAKWDFKEKGYIVLWGHTKNSQWFWVKLYYCLECGEDEMSPVIYRMFSKNCSLQELIREGAEPFEIIRTFYRILTSWHKLAGLMEEAWSKAQLAFHEDL
jgi:hypothetical protein